MAILPQPSVFRQASEALSRLTPELAWFAPVRQHALQRFLVRGFPGTDQEDWRYTDLRGAAARGTELLATPADDPVSGVPTELPVGELHGCEGVHVVLVDGVVHAGLSSLPAVPGLRIHSLRSLPAGARTALLARLADPIDAARASLADFNAALLRDVLLIECAPGTQLAAPVYVTCFSRAGRLTPTRILVTIGARSRVTVIEHHLSRQVAFATVVSDVRCGEHAALNYAILQHEHEGSTRLATQSFALEQRAVLNISHLDLGAGLARSDLEVRLLGEAAAVHAHGLFIADGTRHLDNHTRIDHMAAHTVSRELYRGILDDSGRGVFNGKIIVHPGATGADGYLTNQNLLLARTAEIDTKPELEIYTNDVNCRHGATTGQLDPAALFYLRSRGLDAAAARRLLIAAFAREIVTRSPRGPVTERLIELLRGRLPELKPDFSA